MTETRTREGRIAAGQEVARAFMLRLSDAAEFGRPQTVCEPDFGAWLAARGETLRRSSEDELIGTLDQIFLKLSPSTCTRRSQGKAAGKLSRAAEDQAHNAALRQAYEAAKTSGEVQVRRVSVALSLDSLADRAHIRRTLKRARRQAQQQAA